MPERLIEDATVTKEVIKSSSTHGFLIFYFLFQIDASVW